MPTNTGCLIRIHPWQRAMRVLVLGGTTLTGPYAIRRLHRLGHKVTVFHRGEHETDLPADVRHVHAEFGHAPPELLDSAPDVVVHMWAMTEAAAHWFVDTFRGIAGRAVVISSGDVYRAYGRLWGLEPGPPDPIPLDENAPLRESRYPYRKMAPSAGHWMTRYDKILVERVVMSQPDLPTTVLRYPAVMGPGDYRRFRHWLQPMLRGDLELAIPEGWAEWRFTHGFAADVAEAVVLAVTNSAAAGRVYNVGEPQTPSMQARLAEFAKAIGWRGEITRVPMSALAEEDRMPHDFAHHLVYDTTRIRAELGYAEVTPQEEALQRVIEWENAA
jgi:nucleoside-diphosphate-sugar epimerase